MVAAVVDAFRRRHGRPPDGVWRAPGRVNLLGEHTDYNGGRCLPIALQHATYAAVGRRTDGLVTAESLQVGDRFEATWSRLTPEAISGWTGYCVGVVWAAREAGLAPPELVAAGLDVVVSSDVPIGAGLSSSASLECSVAIAVSELAGRPLDDATRRSLVEIGITAERDVAGAPTGGLDQTVSLFARPDHALALDFATGTMRHVLWNPSDGGLGLLVVDTGATHRLSDSGYGERRRQCELASALLGVDSLSSASLDDLERLDDPVLRRRARHVVTENARVDASITALARGDWPEVGALFEASHRSLRDDFEVSCDELDVACERAVAHGALGARMTGGGFGGSAIVLVPDEALDAVCREIADAYAERGWAPPSFVDGSAGGGAGRVPD